MEHCLQTLQDNLAILADNVVVTAIDEYGAITYASAILNQSFATPLGDRDKDGFDKNVSAIQTCLFTHGPPAAVCPTQTGDVQRFSTIPDAIADADQIEQQQRADLREYQLLAGSDAAAKVGDKDPITKRLPALKSDLDATSTDVATLISFRDKSLRLITWRDFIVERSITCKGLFNYGLTDTVTITLSTSAARTVTLTCPTLVFVSLGFGYDGIPSATYSSVPFNSAGQPAPAAGATPVPSTIQQSNVSAGRSLVTTMADFAFDALDDQGSAFSLSLGGGYPVFSGRSICWGAFHTRIGERSL